MQGVRDGSGAHPARHPPDMKKGGSENCAIAARSQRLTLFAVANRPIETKRLFSATLPQTEPFARLTHFVRFPDLHGDQFWSAVRTFGRPDFLHRHWDRRARREIADGDLVLFAKGEADQPHVPFNGDDEAYAPPHSRHAGGRGL